MEIEQWDDGVVFKVHHIYRSTRPNVIDIYIHPPNMALGEKKWRVAVTNLSSKCMQLHFGWYEISEKEFKRVRTVPAGKRKIFMVGPLGSNLLVEWRSV